MSRIAFYSGSFDPVTEADRGAERAMRAVLAALRPDDAIQGEEYGRSEGRSGCADGVSGCQRSG